MDVCFLSDIDPETEHFQTLSGWNLMWKWSLNPFISCRIPVLLLSLYSEFTANKIGRESQWSTIHTDNVSLYVRALHHCHISLYRAAYISFPSYTAGNGNRLHTGTQLGLLLKLKGGRETHRLSCVWVKQRSIDLMVHPFNSLSIPLTVTGGAEPIPADIGHHQTTGPTYRDNKLFTHSMTIFSLRST